jgi:hypothetical protein
MYHTNSTSTTVYSQGSTCTSSSCSLVDYSSFAGVDTIGNEGNLVHARIHSTNSTSTNSNHNDNNNNKVPQDTQLSTLEDYVFVSIVLPPSSLQHYNGSRCWSTRTTAIERPPQQNDTISIPPSSRSDHLAWVRRSVFLLILHTTYVLILQSGMLDKRIPRWISNYSIWSNVLSRLRMVAKQKTLWHDVYRSHEMTVDGQSLLLSAMTRAFVLKIIMDHLRKRFTLPPLQPVDTNTPHNSCYWLWKTMSAQ